MGRLTAFFGVLSLGAPAILHQSELSQVKAQELQSVAEVNSRYWHLSAAVSLRRRTDHDGQQLRRGSALPELESGM
jgi:hypothetical protein